MTEIIIRHGENEVVIDAADLGLEAIVSPPPPPPGPDLLALSLSETAFTVGAPASATLSGETSGSAISASDLPAGFTYSDLFGTIYWDGSGGAGTPTIMLTETLAGSPNSPRTTDITLSVTAATATLNPISLGVVDDFEVPGSLPRANWTVRKVGSLGGWAASGGTFGITAYSSTEHRAAFGVDFGNRVVFRSRISTKPRTAGGDDPYIDNMTRHYLHYADEDNHISVMPNVGLKRLYVEVMQDGAAIPATQWAAPEIVHNSSFDLLVQIDDGVMRARIGSRWLEAVSGNGIWPYDTYAVPVPPANRRGPVGLSKIREVNPITEAMSADALRLTFDEHPAFVPVLIGETSVSVPLSGKYYGTPSAWFYRVLNKDGAPRGGWTDCTSQITASAGAWSGSFDVPVAGTADDIHIIELAYNQGGVAYSMPSKQFSVGLMFGYLGQSNSIMRATSAWTGYLPNMLAHSKASAGARIGDWTSEIRGNADSFTRIAPYETAKIIAQAINRPVACCAMGVGGNALASLSPGGSSWTTVQNHIAAAGRKFTAIIWDQGEGDADQSTNPTYYANDFRTVLLPALRTEAQNPNLKILMTLVGKYDNPAGNGLPVAQFNSQRDTLYKQIINLSEQEPGAIFLSAAHLGEQHLDAYHYTAAGYTENCRRAAWSVLKHVLGVGTHDGWGPTISGALRDGSTITLLLALNGATSLTGSALTGYEVSADGGTTWAAPASATVSGTDILLTLASAPSAPVKVRSFYGALYNDSSLAMGTYSDTTPIPVAPIINALVSD